VNTFSKIFIPPTAIIIITTESQWDPTIPPSGDFTGVLILDGSLSDHPGDGYIKKWSWTITQTAGPGIVEPQYDTIGRKIRAPDYLTDGDTYDIVLTVEDNYGMTGSITIQYP
jgi:hypothetical protein